jgi:hypothetical protein
MHNPSNAPTVPPGTQAASKGGKLKVKKDPVLSAPREETQPRLDSNGSSPEPAAHNVSAPQPLTRFAPPPPETGSSGATLVENFGPLPQSYHQDSLFLIARDPRWLFAYWDFDWGRMPKSAMRDDRVAYFLRITRESGEVESIVEIHPGARNWYLPVQQANTVYRATLGYFNTRGLWQGLVDSPTAHTPSDTLAPDMQEAAFATVPQSLTFEKLNELVNQHMSEGESLLEAIARITREGHVSIQRGQTPTWTEEQKRLLALLLGQSLIDTIGLGSEEIDRLLRKSLQEKLHSEVSSGLAARLAAAFGSAPSSLFSPLGASWSTQPFGSARGFFMHLNAEIVFYGGTAPDASVRVNGQPVTLAPDGTFRFHFTLPDGDFEIPIVATSADGLEERSGTLSFTRNTRRTGAVTDTVQPHDLEPLIGRRSA